MHNRRPQLQRIRTTKPAHTTTLPWAGCTRNWPHPRGTRRLRRQGDPALSGSPEAGSSANIIFEELTDLYIQTNRLRDAVTQAEEMLKKNPDNLDARRMLGRIYTRMLGDSSAGRSTKSTLKQAIEQYQKITEKEPKDAESWVMLGRLYHGFEQSPEAEKALQSALAGRPG